MYIFLFAKLIKVLDLFRFVVPIQLQCGIYEYHKENCIISEEESSLELLLIDKFRIRFLELRTNQLFVCKREENLQSS